MCRVAMRLKQGLDATEQKVFKGDEDEIIYSKPLIAHRIRLDSAKLAAQLLEMEPAERHVFPDKDGNPQPLGAVFGDIERSARLIFLLEKAKKCSK